MDQSMLARKRKERDIAKLVQKNYKVERDPSNPDHFSVAFEGPADTPYEGGLWQLRVFLPDNYPYKSPSIGFANRLFHPNVDFQCAQKIRLHLSRRDQPDLDADV